MNPSVPFRSLNASLYGALPVDKSADLYHSAYGEEMSPAFEARATKDLHDAPVRMHASEVYNPSWTKTTEIKHKLDNLATAAALAKQGYNLISKEGTNLFTAGTTLAVGLAQFFSGNLFLGVPLSYAGAKGIVAACQRANGNDNLKSMLENIKGSFEVIEHLEQANAASMDRILTEVDFCQKNTDLLNNVFTEIQAIADENIVSVRNAKLAALESYQKATEAQKRASQTLQESHLAMQVAQKQFAGTLNQIRALVALANQPVDNPQKQLEMFAEMSEKVAKDYEQAYALLTASEKKFEQGLREMDGANALILQVSLDALRATNESEKALLKIKHKADTKELISRHQDSLNKIGKEARQAKTRAEIAAEVAAEGRAVAEEAQRAADNKFGMESMLIGGGTGALFGGALGPVGTVIGAPVGAAVYHYGKAALLPMADWAQKAFYPESIKETVLNLPLPKKNEEKRVSMTYDVNSSGVWGRFMGRASQTVGTVSIHLGDTIMHYRFNKQEAGSGKMLPREAHRLSEDLKAALENGSLTKEGAKSILRDLREGVSPSSSEPTVRMLSTFEAFIAQSDPQTMTAAEMTLFDIVAELRNEA